MLPVLIGWFYGLKAKFSDRLVPNYQIWPSEVLKLRDKGQPFDNFCTLTMLDVILRKLHQLSHNEVEYKFELKHSKRLWNDIYTGLKNVRQEEKRILSTASRVMDAKARANEMGHYYAIMRYHWATVNKTPKLLKALKYKCLRPTPAELREAYAYSDGAYRIVERCADITATAWIKAGMMEASKRIDCFKVIESVRQVNEESYDLPLSSCLIQPSDVKEAPHSYNKPSPPSYEKASRHMY